MKKAISLLLCLVICASMFTGTAIPASAVGTASNFLSVENSGFADDYITYTVSLKPNQNKLTGAIVYAVYDSTALQVVEDKTHAAGTYDANGEVEPFVSGVYATGKVYSDANAYSLGFLSSAGYTVGATGAELFQITFKAISQDRLNETVEFKCVEYITDDGDASNDIDRTTGAAPQSFASHTFHTLSVPQVTEVNSYYDGLKVVWDAEPGAQKYHLYRKATTDTAWALVASNIEDTSYIDNTITKGVEYSYTLSAENAGGKTAYDEAGLPGMNFGNIETITVTEAPDGAGANVSWSELYGADYYELYRKLGASGEEGWQLIKKLSSTSFVDGTVGSGIVYNYKVRAFQGKYSADMICEVPSFKFISVPVTTVENTFGGIEIGFIPSNGAESYVIEKKVGDGAFAQFKTILASEITGEKHSILDADVTPEETYTYTIQAIAQDLVSAKRTLAAVKRLSNTTITSVENNSKGVKLTWNAVNGAAEYDIYRKTTAANAVFRSVAISEATSYVDTTAKSGTQYIYSVVAKNATGNGDYSVNEMEIMYLNTPIFKSIASNNLGIKLDWYTVNGAESYNVYRAEAGGTPVKIANVSATTYTNLLADITLNKTYTYTVEAVSGQYKSAIDSNGKQGMHFGVVDNVKATTSNGKAVLTWTAIPADSYIVYRRTAGETSWGDPIAENVKTNTYTDANMTSGVAYEYMVNAKKGDSIADMVCPVVGAKILSTPEIAVKNTSKGIEVKIVENVGGADKYVIEKLVGSSYVSIAEISGTAKLVYADLEVEPKVTYKYRAYAVANATSTQPLVKSSYSAVKSVERIGAPDILTITNDIPGIYFTWEEVETATGYQIMRKTGEDGQWALIYPTDEKDQDFLDTEYTDMDVAGGVKYYYAISASTTDGGNTGFVDDGVGITFVETPDLLSVKNTYDGIQFTWDSVPGAAKYAVYRRASNGSWKNLGTTTSTSFLDTASLDFRTGYYYTVRAITADGNRGYYDEDGLGIKRQAVPKLSNSASGVTVKWKKVAGAKNYYIYRKYGSGGWQRIKIVGASTLSYTDTAVKNNSGKTYSYTVRAVNGSAGSSYGTYTIKRLANPKVTLSNYGSGVQVKWGKVAGASKYIVYRKYGSGGWKQIYTTTSGTSFKDTAVNKQGGKTYSYTVKVVSGSYTSAYTTYSIKRLYTPTLSSIKSTKSGMQVAWKPVTGASGYYVYRKTTGGWTKVATIKSGKTVKYVDKKAKKGTTYTYTVKAYSGKSTSAHNTKGLKCKDKY